MAPVRYIGKISYSLYLWHWPAALIQAEFYPDSVTAALVGIAAVTALSAVTYEFVEQPLRTQSWLRKTSVRTFASAAAFTVASVGAVHATTLALPSARSVIELADGSKHKIADLRLDRPIISKMKKPRCLLDIEEIKSPPCIFGETKAEKSIVLFGDSHAAHWFPALQKLAKDNGYRLIARTKSACAPFGIDIYQSAFKRIFTECTQWKENTWAEIDRMKNTIVVVGSSSLYLPAELRGEQLEQDEVNRALRERARALADRLGATGMPVFFILDTPIFAENPIKCLSVSRDFRRCGLEKEKALKNPFPWGGEKDFGRPNVKILSMNDIICPDAICLPYGKSLVHYRDRGHMTATYSRSLAGELQKRLGIKPTTTAQ
jgi:hypothetical protein